MARIEFIQGGLTILGDPLHQRFIGNRRDDGVIGIWFNHIAMSNIGKTGRRHNRAAHRLRRRSNSYPYKWIAVDRAATLVEYFLSGQYPIHRDRLAALGRTNDPQGSGPARAPDYLDIVASNDFATAQTKALFIERMPVSKLIQSPQSGEFVGIGQFDRMEQCHSTSMPTIDKLGQSGGRMIS